MYGLLQLECCLRKSGNRNLYILKLQRLGNIVPEITTILRIPENHDQWGKMLGIVFQQHLDCHRMPGMYLSYKSWSSESFWVWVQILLLALFGHIGLVSLSQTIWTLNYHKIDRDNIGSFLQLFSSLNFSIYVAQNLRPSCFLC